MVADGSAPADLDPEEAGRWLRSLDEKGSRAFRERLATEAAAGDR
jgi:hypothetical protein